MNKENKNKLFKTALATSAVLLPASIGLGVFVALANNDEHIKNQNNVYKLFSETEILYKVYGKKLDLYSETFKDLDQKFETAHKVWNDKEIKPKTNNDSNPEVQADSDEQTHSGNTLSPKLDALHVAQNAFLEAVIANFDKLVSNNDKDFVKQFWKEFISNQANRIREIDIRTNFENVNNLWLENFVNNSPEMSKENIQEFLGMFSEKLNEFIQDQDSKLKTLLDKSQNAVDFVNENSKFEAMSNNVKSALSDLVEKASLAQFRLNEVEISSQLSVNKANKFSELLNNNPARQEISTLENEISNYINSENTPSELKDKLLPAFDKAKQNLSEALNNSDLDLSKSELVSLKDSILDKDRPTNSLRESLQSIQNAASDKQTTLPKVKDLVLSKIASALSASDADLLQEKEKVNNMSLAFSVANELSSQLQQKLSKALENNLITETEKVRFNSNLETILSSLEESNFDEKLKEYSDQANLILEDLNSRESELEEANVALKQLDIVTSSPYVKPEIAAKSAQLKNKIQELKSNSALPGAALAAMKKDINEEMRNLLKDNLSNIIEDLSAWVQKLNDQSTSANQPVIVKSQELANQLKPLTEPNNPVLSVDLLKSFNLVKDGIQNARTSFEQTKTAEQSSFTRDKLRVVFSDGNENYELTENETKRTEAYEALNDKLDELRKQINEGNSDPTLLDQVRDISKKLLDMESTAQDFKDLSDADKKAKEAIEKAKESKNAERLQPLINDLEEKRRKVADLFNNTNATASEIELAKKELEKATKALNDENDRLDLNDKLQALRDKAAQTFTNPTTPAAKGMQSTIEQLQNEINAGNLSAEDVARITDKIDQLSNLVEPLNDLEEKRAKANQTRSNVSSNPGAGDLTNAAVSEELELDKKAQNLIDQLANGQVPSLSDVQGTANQLENSDDKMKLALQKDRINAYKEQLKATKSDSESVPATKNNNNIDAVSNEAEIKVTSSDLDELTVYADKLEKQSELAKELAKMQDVYDELAKDPANKIVSDYVEGLMLDNGLSNLDNQEDVEAKIENLKKAAALIEAKKDIAQLYKEADDILGDEKTWKNHEDTKNEIDKLLAEINNTLYDNSLTPEELAEKKAAFKDKITELKAQKDKENADWAKAVEAVDAIEKFDDQENQTLAEKPRYVTNPADKPTFYDKAREQYEAAKENRELTSVEDINAFADKLNAAVNKDKVLDKLNEIKGFINSDADFGTSTNHGKIKSEAENFIADILGKLNNPDLTSQEVEQLLKKATEQQNLVLTQDKVADKILSLEDQAAQDGSNNVNEESKRRLQDALNQYRITPTEYANGAVNQQELQKVLDKESTISNIRDELEKQITSESTENPGLLKMLNDGLDNARLEDAQKYKDKIKEIMDSWIKEIKAIENENDPKIEELRNRIQTVKNDPSSIINLIKSMEEADQAKTVTEVPNKGLQNPDAPGVIAYKKALEDEMSKADNLIKNLTDIEAIKAQRAKIQDLTLRLQKVDELNTLINTAVNTVSAINFFRLEEYKGQQNPSGIEKRREMINYLKSYDTKATELMDQDLAQITNLKVDFETKAKPVVELQKEFEARIKELNELSKTYIGNLTDAEQMIILLWDTVPAALTSANPEGLRARVLRADTTNSSSQSVEEFRSDSDWNRTINEYRIETNLILEGIANQTSYTNEQEMARVAVSKKASAMISENNDSVDLSKTQNAGRLYELRQEANLFQTLIEDYKSLASVTKKFKNLNGTIVVPEESSTTDQATIENYRKISAEKEKAQALIDSAEALINKSEISQQTLSELKNKTKEVSEAFDKMQLLIRETQEHQSFISATTLSDSEKAPIQALFDQFWAEYNQIDSSDEITSSILLDKYFPDYKNLSDQERQAKNMNVVVSYALKNTKDIKAQLATAKTYLSLENSDLDSQTVKTRFADLKAKVEKAQAAIDALPNIESAKVAVLSELRTANEAVLSAKKAQLAEQAQAAEELKTFLTLTKLESLKKLFNVQASADNQTPYMIATYDVEAINKLKENVDDLSFGETNSLLRASKAMMLDQLINVYSRGVAKVYDVEQSLSVIREEFRETDLDAIYGANLNASDLSSLRELDTEISDVKNNQSRYRTIDNYQSTLEKLIEISNSDTEGKIAAFVTKVKEQFKSKLATGAEAGFYSLINATFDADLVQKLDENSLASVKESLEKVKQQIADLSQRFSTTQNSSDYSEIANYARDLQSLNEAFADFVKYSKQSSTTSNAYNPLVNVYSDLYKSIDFNNPSDSDPQNIKDLKTMYDQHLASLTSALEGVDDYTIEQKTLQDAENYGVNKLNGSSVDKLQAIKTILVNIDDHAKWVQKQEVKDKLFAQIDLSSRINRTLGEAPTQDNQPFEKKYQEVIVVDDVTKEAFEKTLNTIAANATDLVDITENDLFLEYFNTFAFTKKDATLANQMASMFSQNRFRVNIKKQGNAWFTETAQTEEEVLRKTISLKLVYTFESQNSDIKNYQVEKDIKLTFKTLDTMKLPDQTSSIFIDNSGNVGLNAKVKLANVKELGWLTTNKTKEDIIRKAFDKIKRAILSVQNVDGQSVNYQDINMGLKVQGNDSPPQRTSVGLDPSAKTEKFEIKVSAGSYMSVTYNVGVVLDPEKAYTRIEVIDRDGKKELAIYTFTPGEFNGAPIHGNTLDRKDYQPSQYDFDLLFGELNAFQTDNPAYTPKDRVGSSTNVNAYKFALDYDVATGDLFLFNTWTENALWVTAYQKYSSSTDSFTNNLPAVAAKIKDNFDIDKDANADKKLIAGYRSEQIEKYRNIVREYANVGSGRVSSELMTKLLWAYSSIYDKVLSEDPRFNTIISISKSKVDEAANPIWPLGGGQATIIYPNNDPYQATKNVVAGGSDFNVAEFKRDGGVNWGKLLKNSAFNSLYSASISKFFIKLR
ncbi:hypothetical protein [Mycoplasma sp. Ms02]|uniref:hypothetical protein n=1 Tax=Mycoplasma sp. Ms02 TaxID=353851 RepID=UPI001C8ADAF1|nr:hypothetical protein [Mycoplasma sp. Ms02]QZE12675.1 hypothetical protein K4L35_01680 [Mycoplasma sp. Ms02]